MSEAKQNGIDVLGRQKPALATLQDEAIAANRSAYAAIKNALRLGQRLVWGNKDGRGQGPTPEEVAAALGTGAVQWFLASQKLAEALAVIDGEDPKIIPDGWTVTPNADGSVTLTRPR